MAGSANHNSPREEDSDDGDQHPRFGNKKQKYAILSDESSDVSWDESNESEKVSDLMSSNTDIKFAFDTFSNNERSSRTKVIANIVSVRPVTESETLHFSKVKESLTSENCESVFLIHIQWLQTKTSLKTSISFCLNKFQKIERIRHHIAKLENVSTEEIEFELNKSIHMHVLPTDTLMTVCCKFPKLLELVNNSNCVALSGWVSSDTVNSEVLEASTSQSHVTQTHGIRCNSKSPPNAKVIVNILCVRPVTENEKIYLAKNEKSLYSVNFKTIFVVKLQWLQKKTLLYCLKEFQLMQDICRYIAKIEKVDSKEVLLEMNKSIYMPISPHDTPYSIGCNFTNCLELENSSCSVVPSYMVVSSDIKKKKGKNESSLTLNVKVIATIIFIKLLHRENYEIINVASEMKEEFSNLDCEPVFHVEVEWLQNKKNSFYVERFHQMEIICKLIAAMENIKTTEVELEFGKPLYMSVYRFDTVHTLYHNISSSSFFEFINYTYRANSSGWVYSNTITDLEDSKSISATSAASSSQSLVIGTRPRNLENSVSISATSAASSSQPLGTLLERAMRTVFISSIKESNVSGRPNANKESFIPVNRETIYCVGIQWGGEDAFEVAFEEFQPITLIIQTVARDYIARKENIDFSNIKLKIKDVRGIKVSNLDTPHSILTKMMLYWVSKNDEYKIRYRHDYRLYKCLRAPFGYYERKGWYIMRRGIRQGPILRNFLRFHRILRKSIYSFHERRQSLIRKKKHLADLRSNFGLSVRIHNEYDDLSFNNF